MNTYLSIVILKCKSFLYRGGLRVISQRIEGNIKEAFYTRLEEGHPHIVDPIKENTYKYCVDCFVFFKKFLEYVTNVYNI